MKNKITRYMAAFAVAGGLPLVAFAQESTEKTDAEAAKSTETTVETTDTEKKDADQIKSIDKTQTGSATNSRTGTATKIDDDKAGEKTEGEDRKVTPGVSAGGSSGSATNTGSGAKAPSADE